jgi:hypothetical protein
MRKAAHILGLVFSRDRAMQLDATLRSLLHQCSDVSRVDLRVLYSATSAVHQAQYRELEAEYAPTVTFVPERAFRRDTLRELESAASHGVVRALRMLLAASPATGGRLGAVGLHRNRFVLFLVDDNIFVRRFSLGDAADALGATPAAIGFSLRLGANTTHCYPLARSQVVPAFSRWRPGIVSYDWSGADADFAYPLEVSSSLYRLHEMVPLLAARSFRNPNTLESELAARARTFASSHPRLLCFDTSVTFCNPVNKVQSEYDNRAGTDAANSSEGLAEHFARGARIDVASYDGMVPTGCHQEVELRFATRGR